MKNVQNYDAKKYFLGDYEEIDNKIYRKGNEFVTSLCFQQEPDFGEGETADVISQYPLEDILDHFYVHISDFYKELNIMESQICYLEFASINIEYILKLRGIIGKHVYNKSIHKDGKEFVKLIIE
ncbi:hypothetical protein [Sedimentibacter sp. B4]|uniref:hypothetical protein n=1 Tax=Sedimentibacter sp. B4 TaxID=304766 RepID=UPI0002EDA9D5|nr:hypothetical protein [Sedimentibacter sp. B4]